MMYYDDEGIYLEKSKKRATLFLLKSTAKEFLKSSRLGGLNPKLVKVPNGHYIETAREYVDSKGLRAEVGYVSVYGKRELK